MFRRQRRRKRNGWIKVRSFFVFLLRKSHFTWNLKILKQFRCLMMSEHLWFYLTEKKMYEKLLNRERNVIFLDETDSTNNYLKALIRSTSDSVFTVVSARRQTGGRGRLGRSFFSPDGGLYFSFSLPCS